MLPIPSLLLKPQMRRSLTGATATDRVLAERRGAARRQPRPRRETARARGVAKPATASQSA